MLNKINWFMDTRCPQKKFNYCTGKYYLFLILFNTRKRVFKKIIFSNKIHN